MTKLTKKKLTANATRRKLSGAVQNIDLFEISRFCLEIILCRIQNKNCWKREVLLLLPVLCFRNWTTDVRRYLTVKKWIRDTIFEMDGEITDAEKIKFAVRIPKIFPDCYPTFCHTELKLICGKIKINQQPRYNSRDNFRYF